MKGRLILALVALALALGVWLVLDERRGAGAPRAAPTSAAPAPAAASGPLARPREVPSPANDAEDEERARVDRALPAVNTNEKPSLPPDASPELACRARVLDVTGLPLAGVPIRESGHDEVLATSDGGGAFEVVLASGASTLEIEVAESRYTTVRSCRILREEPALEYLVVAAPSVSVAGRVLDEGGVGLEGARLRFDVDDRMLTALPFALDRNRTVRSEEVTDSHGAFRFSALASVPGAKIRIGLDGYDSTGVDVPTVDRSDLYVTLEKTHLGDALAVTGRVVLPDGTTPARGATVQYAWHETTTDADGSFVLPHTRDLDDGIALAAGLLGYGTAIVENFAQVLADAAPGAPDPLELVLHAPLKIKGRVVDEENRGLADWTVMIRAGVSTSTGSIPPPWAESLAGDVEVQSGETGAFELSGLLDREYEVWAYAPETLQVVETDEPVRAGTDGVVLVAHAGELYERVSGVVLSRGGIPVPSVYVSVQRVTYAAEGGSSSVGGQSVATDDDGRFTLFDVPRDGILINVSGSEVVPEEHHAEPDDHREDLDDLRLSVARRCHFQVHVAGADSSGLQMRMLDDLDHALAIYSFRSNGWMSSSTRAVQQDGKTPVLAVSEDAKVLVLTRGSEEFARRAVSLLPGGVNEIRVP